MQPAFAVTPPPPYYAVIFTSQRTATDPDEYAAAAERMVGLAQGMPGFLGVETARDSGGFGMTISYWESEDAIRGWRLQAEHAATRDRGRWRWYEHFEVRVARVERAYSRRDPG